MVTLAIISVLVAIITPGLSQIKETARRAKCGLGQRQIGMGILMFASDYDDALPSSSFLRVGPRGEETKPEETMTLRLMDPEAWDGLGQLRSGEYIEPAPIYYCDSYHGQHTYEAYERQWLGAQGHIVGNYQYRGEGPNGERHLSQIVPEEAALLTDGMRTIEDYSHQTGSNVLRADMVVFWYNDPSGELAGSLAPTEADVTSGTVRSAWQILDDFVLGK